MMDCSTWIHSSPYAPLPPFAVIGGHDCDGAPIYVGRSFHEGDNLPAKVIPSKGSAYVAWGGQEIGKTHYEILVGEGYSWVPCYGGSVPPNAVRTGNTRTGEPLYIGRGHHANSLTVGKIHPSHGCLYIPFGGQEISVHTYEVLVYQNRENWVASTPNYTPPGAVMAGHDTDRTPIYVGRALHEDHRWVHSFASSLIPANAIIGGHDSDGSAIYVGRSFHNGDTVVAKVIPSKHTAFVSWRGQEIAKDHFEVLCGKNLEWRQCPNHIIPENSVICGKSALGQSVFVGRGHFEGSLTVGKVSSVHRALFIPFKGIERRLETYEILVAKQQSVGWAINSSEKMEQISTLESQRKCIKADPFDPSAPPLLSIKTELKPTICEYIPMPQPPPLGAYQTFCPETQFEPPPPYVPPYAPSYCPMLTINTRNQSRPHDLWATASASYIPPNAVQAGHDTDLSIILVSRAFHEGCLLPGKALPSRGCSYISFAGQEIPKSHFEILVGDGYHWVSAHDGNVTPGAVEAGRSSNGEVLFVGRAHYCGSLTPGRIQRSHQCLYIAFGGAERRIVNYEVLVRSN